MQGHRTGASPRAISSSLTSTCDTQKIIIQPFKAEYFSCHLLNPLTIPVKLEQLQVRLLRVSQRARSDGVHL